LSTNSTFWVTVVADDDTGSTATRAGSTRMPEASEAISWGMVGREQQVLPLARQLLQDAADGLDEAHVQHAVGLVQHQHLDGVEAGVSPAASDPAGGPGWPR
jgi:hypothetical protein